MRRAPAVLALLVALVAPLPVAAPGGAAGPARAGTVALAPLPAMKGEVGRPVRMSGRAPAGKTVAIQQRRGERWVRVAGTQARRDGTFSLKVPMTRAGTQRFRAVSDGATSGVRTLPVFRWLWLVDQPAYADGALVWDATTRTATTRLPHSVEGHGGTVSVVVSSRSCDKASVRTAFPRYDTGLFEGDEEMEVILSPVDDGTIVDEAQQSIGTSSAGEAPKKLDVDLPRHDHLAFFAGYDDPDGLDDLPALLGSPRLHCAAESLPTIRFDEVPF